MLLSARSGGAATTLATARDSALTVRGGAFGHGRDTVLTGVDLTVHPGEVLAVRGPNGAGKSTLIRGVLGLSEVRTGEIRLFDVPRARFRDWHRVGYVPQGHTVAGGVPVTVRELVSTGRLSRLRPWQRFGAADRCAVDCALEGAGLAGFDRRLLAELSGGERRRTLLARALAGDPELLLLDEPTAGVDAASQRVVAGTLAGLAETGAAVVVVLHDLGPLADVVTRTVTLPGAGAPC